MGRGVREETTTLQIVRAGRVERVSGRIVRAAKRVTVRAGRVVKASDLQDHVGKVSVRVGRKVVGIVRIVRAARKVTARVATSIVRGGKIVPNVLLPMLNVGPMKFVAPKVVASTRAAKCHTSVRPKSDGSMRDPSARPSLPSESSKNQFASVQVRRWRRSIHEHSGHSLRRSANAKDSVKLVA